MAGDSTSSFSISVHITITIDPANNAAFLEVLRQIFEAAINEPLNTYMEVLQYANNPGVFRIVEN
jgi:quinol monooxygenase YgiN